MLKFLRYVFPSLEIFYEFDKRRSMVNIHWFIAYFCGELDRLDIVVTVPTTRTATAPLALTAFNAEAFKK